MAGIAPSRKKQFATDLGDRWSGFLIAVLDPWTILLLITTLAFVYGATVQSNKPLTAMFSGLAAVCSSIFGGLVTNRWQESAQTEVLVARGKSAIRNLKLLLSSVVGLSPIVPGAVTEGDQVWPPSRLTSVKTSKKLLIW